MERRKKILVAVLLAAIITVPAVTIWLYQYQEDSSYGGAYKLAVDSYYSGNPLPKPYSVPASYYQFNLTGQVTVSYSLANYSFYRWINDSQKGKYCANHLPGKILKACSGSAACWRKP